MKVVIKWTSDYDRWNGFDSGDLIEVHWSEVKHAYVESLTGWEFIKRQVIIIDDKELLFSKGDVVELDHKSEFCNKEGDCNPINIKGEIINVNFYNEYPFFVRWENGELNSYNYEDLKLIIKNDENKD